MQDDQGVTLIVFFTQIKKKLKSIYLAVCNRFKGRRTQGSD